MTPTQREGWDLMRRMYDEARRRAAAHRIVTRRWPRMHQWNDRKWTAVAA